MLKDLGDVGRSPSPQKGFGFSFCHGCRWETSYMFAYCSKIFAPLPRSTNGPLGSTGPMRKKMRWVRWVAYLFRRIPPCFLVGFLFGTRPETHHVGWFSLLVSLQNIRQSSGPAQAHPEPRELLPASRSSAREDVVVPFRDLRVGWV